jgi:hypothetical protein
MCSSPIHQNNEETLPPDQWTYIQVDDSRAKWGDWSDPEWLRYFGLDFRDINQDQAVDIVSGRYVYLNPDNDMTSQWPRVDLGMNVDGMLFLDVDGDVLADIIAQALPEVYWFEAIEPGGESWQSRRIGELPQTGHVNGQGYRTADLIPGGKSEILLQADQGIYACAVPDDPLSSDWKWVMIAASGSDEGIGVGDLNSDGLIDIVIGDIEEGQKEHPRILKWCENPGSLSSNWSCTNIGRTEEAIDRIEVADLNGDDRPDVVVAEERYPGEEPDGHLWWFESPEDPTQPWNRHLVVTQYSMNNLDVGDIDLDGDIDIVTNMHKGPSLATQIWVNDGSGRFSKQLVDTGKEMHLGAQLIDLDLDGDLDIVGHAWDNYQYLHIWRNDAIQK